MNFSINNETVHFEIPKEDRLEIISFSRKYKVLWDLSAPCEKINESLNMNPNNLLLIDEKVFRLYGDNIHHPKSKIFLVPATEEFKQLEGVTKVYKFLYRNNFCKSDTLIVVGGGITQEIGAFVSATYKRGIDWIFFPTTVLAMSDSCIGGKASINYEGAKNQLGLFSVPAGIIINPAFINTLDQRDIHSGLGEILKMAIIGGDELLGNYGKSFLKDNYKSLILSALAVKKAVIEKDEFEHNIRKVLNYGHTFGHAIESVSDYQISHGIAVVMGMMLANEIATNNGLLDRKKCNEIHALCSQLIDDNSRKILKEINTNSLGFYLQQDKKALAGKIVFILLNHPGKMCFVPFKIDDNFMSEIANYFKMFY